MDEYEVRSATGWYRHMTLALWALALLAVLRATTLPDAAAPVKKSPRAGVGLSLAAVRHLLWQTRLRTVLRTRHVLAWLDWKRYHGWTAQCCHYRRRAQLAALQLQY